MCTSNPSLRNKSLRFLNKVAHVELSRGDAMLVPQCVMTATYRNREHSMQKRFTVLRQKRARQKKYFITTNFEKSLFMTQCRMRVCDLHTFRLKIPRNKPYDGYLWKPAKGNIARTSKQLRFVALKHLMETSLMV